MNSAVRLEPTNALRYIYRASAYGASGQYERAIRDCNEALRSNPKLSSALYTRGLAYMWKQEYEKAIADLREASRLDPYNSDVSYALEYARRAANDIMKPKKTPIEKTNFLKDYPAMGH